MSRRNCPVVFLLLLSACTSRSSQVLHSFRVYEEDGVTIAETTGGPKYEEELFSYEKVLEIRGDPSEQRSFLVSPYPPTMDSEGYLYVPDTKDHRIVVFSPDGQFVREFGQGGEGPGDLSLPTDIQILGNQVVVTSRWIPAGVPNRQRITSFTLLGVLQDIFIEGLDRSHQSHLYYCTPTGERIATWWDSWIEDLLEYEQAECIIESADNDTIARIESPVVARGKEITVESRGRVLTRVEYTLFTARAFIVYLPPNRVVVSDGNRQLLQYFNLAGHLVREVRIDIPKEPVTREDREHLIQLYGENGENLRFPEEKAFWGRPRVDDSGCLWLQIIDERPSQVYVDRNESFRLIGPDGEYMGDTVWPAVTMAKVQQGCLLAVVTNPDTGEGIPTVFKIHPAVEGLKYP